MRKLFLLLLCAAFAFVGCEGLNGEDILSGVSDQPVFVTTIDGDYVVSAEGGVVEVAVATNLDYTVSISENAKSWVSHVETRSIRQQTVVFSIAKNSTTQSRTAAVSMVGTNGNVLETIIFVQNAAAADEPNDEPENPGDNPNDNPNQNPSEITLSADSTSVEVGEVITFTVTDGTGKNVTASSTIYDINYSVVKNAKYKTDKEGTLRFFATRNGYTSNTLVVTVGNGVDDPEQNEGGAFLHKVLVIDHTGVNCGYCPSAIDNLRNLESKTSWGPYYNVVSCHAGGYASGDPARSTVATQLNSFQSNLINGYPSIAINLYNRASSYSYSDIASALASVVKKDGADVGIALTVEKGSSKVTCSAQIKAAVSNEYKVNAWLLENNIYSPNQNGATKDYHYYYNHAIRNTSETVSAGDFSGKSIGMLYIGETYNYNCEVSVDSSWEMNNLEVLIVVTARDGSNRWNVVNTAVCGVGESTPFAYIQ